MDLACVQHGQQAYEVLSSKMLSLTHMCVCHLVNFGEIDHVGFKCSTKEAQGCLYIAIWPTQLKEMKDFQSSVKIWIASLLQDENLFMFYVDSNLYVINPY